MASQQRWESLSGYKAAGFSKRHTMPLSKAWHDNGEKRKPHGFLLDLPTEAANAKRARAWDALTKEGGWVLLLGDRGTGKSQMAADFGFRLADEGLLRHSPERISYTNDVKLQHYTTVLELFSEEKNSWHDRASVSPLHIAAQHQYLVLDEAQERSDTAWEDANLSVLLDRRYRNMLRTVLISNLDVAGAKAKLPASVWSRLTETGAIVHCDWPSFRKAAL